MIQLYSFDESFLISEGGCSWIISGVFLGLVFSLMTDVLGGLGWVQPIEFIHNLLYYSKIDRNNTHIKQ